MAHYTCIRSHLYHRLDAPAYINHHSLTIGGKNDGFKDEDLLRLAQRNDIKDAEGIIHQVKSTISYFSDYAKANGLDIRWTERIEQRLREINA